MMKSLYFLQTLRRVPLGYKFGLYTYGPFDSMVLDDLRHAQAVGAIKVLEVLYPTGMGYEMTPGDRADAVIEASADFVKRHSKDIENIVDLIGNRTAGELEMFSTIIYVDQDAAFGRRRLSKDELENTVVRIKPHLSMDAIRTAFLTLNERGLLQAVQ